MMSAGARSRAGRSVWFTAPRRAEVITEPVRPPQAQEITVQTIVSLISAGTELKYYRGHTDLSADVGLPTSAGGGGYPVKFGYDCVGRVIEAGPDARRQPDDLVFVRHPHQDVFTAPVDQTPDRAIAVGLPPEMDPEVGMFLNLAEVAVTALLDIPVTLGDVVVVFGQGVVGLLVAQLARRTAGRLLVVDPLPMRRDLARSLGVDAAVTPEEVEEAVRGASDGRGADVVFEASGAPAALQQAIRVAGREGTIGVVSFYGDRPVKLILAPEFHVGRLKVISTQGGGFNALLRPRWDFRRRTRTAIELLPSLHTAAMITHRIPFERAPDAFRLIDENPGETLAVALIYPR
jgi:2-desacetyl-2-hydroxyethyl bacteriochlorophyllide A dehydrogenase